MGYWPSEKGILCSFLFVPMKNHYLTRICEFFESNGVFAARLRGKIY